MAIKQSTSKDTGNSNDTGVIKPQDASKLWDETQAPEVGGQNPILEMDVNQAAGPFTYIADNPMTLNNKEVIVHLVSDEQGNTIRMPIAASFIRAFSQAGIQRGEKFLIKRYQNVVKKDGVGKGTAMEIYGVKKLPAQQ